MSGMGFSGYYEHSLDGKGRVIIPSDFREELGDLFTITINPRRTAIAIYPLEIWKKRKERLDAIDPMDEKGMRYVRYVMSLTSVKNSTDMQGRVMIPQRLRAKLGLKKDIIFVGLPNCIEVWDAEAYSAYDADSDEEFDSLADHVFDKYPV